MSSASLNKTFPSFLPVKMMYFLRYNVLHHFYQAAVAVKVKNLLICFCSFDLSCPILEKYKRMLFNGTIQYTRLKKNTI